MLHSRDVRFDETEKEDKMVTNTDDDRHFVLDFSSDQESGDPAVAPRRSARERHQPNYYHDMEWSHLSIGQSEPES